MSRSYPDFAWRRAMRVKEVLDKALRKEILWINAADILGVSPRTIRRIRDRLLEQGSEGLLDQRRGQPSPRRAPPEDVERILELYRKEYRGYNVAHFHEKLVEQHGERYSYSWVLKLLQKEGEVKRGKGRGGHRKRRERRALFGQMMHFDGSDHQWLALCPGERQTLLLAIDDATGRNLAAELVEEETTVDCMRIMRQVVEQFGIPAQFYSDRGSVYWQTPKGGGPVDRQNLTQFGRALEQLGVEMIPAYSPQARGRSERWNGTWQGRWVNELRTAGIKEVGEANRYIKEVFLPEMNRRFTVEPSEAGSAFVSAQGADLNRIFALKQERQVAADNTIRVDNLVLQIERSPFRTSFAKCEVEVYQHLNGTYSVDWKGRCVGRYDDKGEKLSEGPPPVPHRGKRQPRLPGEDKADKADTQALPLKEKRQREGCPSPV